MPIWSEILVLSLVAYALGVGAGWLLWGAAINEREDTTNGQESEHNA